MSVGNIRILEKLYFVLYYIVIDRKHLSDYRMVVWSEALRDEVDSSRRMAFNLGFWCMNPAVVFNPMVKEARSVILSSGTLSPIETFASELSTKFDQKLEALHIIDQEKQVWAASFSYGPSASIELKGTYGEMEKLQFQDDITLSILEVCLIVPYGILCFVPSYGFLDKLMRRMKATGIYDKVNSKKEIFIEPRAGKAKDFEVLIKKYYSKIATFKQNPPHYSHQRTGCIFFAVFRGKVSEGLDFVDENARAVISIGIPYPSIRDEKIILKREYNDKRSIAQDPDSRLLNGSQWYEKQAFRAINQALGRCIRHKDDWGAIILLESRFHQSRNLDQLSRWIRPITKKLKDYHVGMKELKSFIDSKYPNGMVKMTCELEKTFTENYDSGSGSD
jgi:fanconi anemia group J protein